MEKICYPTAYSFTSSATTWGCQHEDEAIAAFLDYYAFEHMDVDFKRSGLVVNPKYPFLGASPDAWVTCSCHSGSLVEVKCPYRCRENSLEQLSSTSKDFFLMHEHGSFSLDESHTYYYQVQCQLNVCEVDTCYFVVWSPSEIVCIEVLRDESFFQNCLPIADSFIDNVLLPEVVAQRFTRETKSGVNTLMTNNLYCICKRPDDGRRPMIYCENENCQNGQWFHLTHTIGDSSNL